MGSRNTAAIGWLILLVAFVAFANLQPYIIGQIHDSYLAEAEAAREQATGQNIVWGTGTHTHTPVNVFAWGPADTILPVSKIMHHSELGEFIKQQVK